MVFLARQHLLGKKKSSEHEKQTHKQRGTVHFSLFWFGFSFFLFVLFWFGYFVVVLDSER
jgi:apolipoprotein N-acyltransferase